MEVIRKITNQILNSECAARELAMQGQLQIAALIVDVLKAKGPSNTSG
jgi:hypothetical protein